MIGRETAKHTFPSEDLMSCLRSKKDAAVAGPEWEVEVEQRDRQEENPGRGL